MNNLNKDLLFSFDEFQKEIIEDYCIAYTSRECSLLGRREVLTGKAKFGIFGDGKELPQVCMAKYFQKGDFRSGYYRDQTFMMAIGELSPQQFFAGLYGHPDINHDPMSGGRQMGGHYTSYSLDEKGNWKDLTKQMNNTADISCTAGQMPKMLGVAQASKLYRKNKNIDSDKFSENGNEISWGTIGNASTSEGLFFEAINAAGVMQVPMVVSVWDDDYGISVHQSYQTTKESISEALKGFQREKEQKGIEIMTVLGWDYLKLIDTYQKASSLAREEHIPILIHVKELTQPQGHSTSGSHERYKDKKRLQWEAKHDCILKMKDWMLGQEIVSEKEIKALEKEIKAQVQDAKNKAWEAYTSEIIRDKHKALQLLQKLTDNNNVLNKVFISKLIDNLEEKTYPYRKDILSTIRKTLMYIRGIDDYMVQDFRKWVDNYRKKAQKKCSTHLYTEKHEEIRINKNITHAKYPAEASMVDARIILRDNFKQLLYSYPKMLIFGEDTGKIGDVNQGLEGLQKKFGEDRVADVGIREATIIGQGIGLALRGFRPIAEIQYLDYITYAMATISDDLGCLHYRTVGKQVAPLIIRTRGHRLEGIFHAGSPMSALIGYMRGIYILVPRNMTQAAGFYNALVQINQPALVIEALNGYRLKEKLPSNLGVFTTPIGEIEIMKEGTDITIVSYGSTLRIVEQAAKELTQVDIICEVIDCQSLIPFDISHNIVKSVQKTNRLLIVDEDVPGGASAYILEQIIEKQNAFQYLDSPPKTLTAQEHRPAYGSDGDYLSKPNIEDVFETAYQIMRETNPQKYPRLI